MDGLHCAFTGYVGGIPELRYTPGGKAALVFSVALTDAKAAERGAETTWLRCTAWESRAEELQDTISKGCEVYIEGKLTMNRWEDRSSGEQRVGLSVSAWKIEVLGAIGKKAPRRQSGEPNQRCVTSQGHSQPRPRVAGRRCVRG